MDSHATVYITRTYMMKGREQQKILHKDTNNDKVYAFITLLYPLNKLNSIQQERLETAVMTS
jgi:hypothetical protein